MGEVFLKFENKKREHIVDFDEENKKIAASFVKQADKELKDFLKAAVLFGSSTRERRVEKTDIDVLMIINDADIIITPELTQTYQLIVKKIAKDTSMRLHISTLKLTSFWEKVKDGDPIIMNVLRDGIPLLDKGFFKSVQALLDLGRIRPTKESIWTYYARSPVSVRNAQKHVMQACVDLYWASIDAAHAALMSVGCLPPSPEHVPDLIQTHLVDTGLLEKKYPIIMRELYELSKRIEHRAIQSVSGKEYDNYLQETRELTKRLRLIVKEHEEHHE